MKGRQRENVAKYLYDISKGIILLTVVGSLVKQEINWNVIISGLIASILSFIWGYIIDGGNNNG